MATENLEPCCVKGKWEVSDEEEEVSEYAGI
jgi:hypothetical protein